VCAHTQKQQKINKLIAFGNAKRIKAFLNAPKTKLKQYILTQQKTKKNKKQNLPQNLPNHNKTQNQHTKNHTHKNH